MSTILRLQLGDIPIDFDPAGPTSLSEVIALVNAARKAGCTGQARAILDATAKSPAPPTEQPRPSGAGTRPGRNVAQGGAPKTTEEAEARFYARYGEAIGGSTWQATQRYLGHLLPRPTSVEEWIAVAEEVRDRLRAA